MSSDYGVKYTSDNVEKKVPLDGVSITGLKDQGIEYIRLQWVDTINNIRYRVIPIAYFEKLLNSPRPGISIINVVFGMVFISLAAGFAPIGEYLYAIDMKSIRLCPYAPGHASVMGYFQEKAPVKGPDGRLTLDVQPCPRSTLKRIVEDAKINAGAEFLVGFETEFILLKSTNPIEVINEHGWSNSQALPSGSTEAQVLEEIARSLRESGIELQMYHAEAAPGQYEVVTGPLPPLKAADALIHTRETITNIASKHGLRATLAPRIFMDNCGSSCHTHLSIHPTHPPTTAEKDVLTSQESSFLAALLEHLPAITAITLPQPSSYKRMVDGVWAGGTYVCWGTENREAPVRLCNAASQSARNFELRFVDGLANPYLALASILGAGTLGIKDQRTLTQQDCDTQTAASMDEESRQAAGIIGRMSLNLDESRKALSADEKLKEVLGDELVTKYLSVNQLLAEKMEAGTEEEKVTRLVENY